MFWPKNILGMYGLMLDSYKVFFKQGIRRLRGKPQQNIDTRKSFPCSLRKVINGRE